MKIMLVTPYFYPKIGGLENYAFSMAKGLQRMHHDVVVISTNHGGKNYTVETIENCKVYRLPILFVISNTPIHIRWFIDIYKIIQKEKPDIINGHTPVPFIADITAMIARVKQIPFVMTYHNDLLKDTLILNLIIKAYYIVLGLPALRFATKIIATSQYYANSSIYINDFKEKIEIVPPGVDLQRFAETSLDKNVLKNMKQQYHNKKILIFIAQLDKTHEHKGLAYLIRALSLIKEKQKSSHLIVVGKGNNIQKYKDLAHALQLELDVAFTGFVTDKDLPYYYNIADILVLPSYNQSEGFGMTLIEAGASRKPVVASNIGGIPFVVKDGSTGFLTKPKDPEDLSKAILALLNNKKIAEEIGKNNYLWVKENFTWDKQIEKTNNIFNSLLGANH